MKVAVRRKWIGGKSNKQKEQPVEGNSQSHKSTIKTYNEHRAKGEERNK